MSNEQLCLAIGIPSVINAALIGLLLAYMNAKFDSVDKRLDGLEKRFDEKFDAINTRFDDMRDLWRAELRRVEDVLDARLKHLEEHLK